MRQRRTRGRRSRRHTAATGAAPHDIGTVGWLVSICSAPPPLKVYPVNSSATSIALPQRQLLAWDRIRGLYNGLSYVVAICVIQDLWWTIQAAVAHLGTANAHDFVLGFFRYALATGLSMLPGPFLVPVIVNLAPRTGWRRIAFLLLAVIPMSWWCLSVVERVTFGWNWSSLGFALDGLLTTSLVVGVCAY